MKSFWRVSVGSFWSRFLFALYFISWIGSCDFFHVIHIFHLTCTCPILALLSTSFSLIWFRLNFRQTISTTPLRACVAQTKTTTKLLWKYSQVFSFIYVNVVVNIKFKDSINFASFGCSILCGEKCLYRYKAENSMSFNNFFIDGAIKVHDTHKWYCTKVKSILSPNFSLLQCFNFSLFFIFQVYFDAYTLATCWKIICYIFINVLSFQCFHFLRAEKIDVIFRNVIYG